MLLQSAFPLLALGFTILAWHEPDNLLPWDSSQPILLALLLFILSLNIRWQDCLRLWRKPGPVMVGITSQWLLVPLLAWLTIQLLPVQSQDQTGLLLTATAACSMLVPAFVLIAGGDLALALVLTLTTPLWQLLTSRWITPLITGAPDTSIPLPVYEQLWLLPAIIAGVSCQHWLPELRQRLHSYLPATVMALLLGLMAIQTASQQDLLAMMVLPPLTISSAVLFCLLCGTGGYWLARTQHLTPAQCRTIALQTGLPAATVASLTAMQASGLESAAVPLLILCWQPVGAACAAGYWHWQTQRQIRTIQRTSRPISFDPRQP